MPQMQQDPRPFIGTVRHAHITTPLLLLLTELAVLAGWPLLTLCYSITECTLPVMICTSNWSCYMLRTCSAAWLLDVPSSDRFWLQRLEVTGIVHMA